MSALEIGIDKSLGCSGGYLAKTVLLSVGELGAEWGLDGGKELRRITGRVLVGDVDGVTKGVSDRGGGIGSRKVSPL